MADKTSTYRMSTAWRTQTQVHRDTHLLVHRYHADPKLASIAHVRSATSSAMRFSYDAGTNSATVPSER